MAVTDDFESTATRSGDPAGPVPSRARPPVLTLDVALYEDCFENSELTDEQKREFLEALWVIIVGFVDLGFDIHPVQQAWQAEGCEQIDENTGIRLSTLLSFQEEQEKEGDNPLGEEEV